MMVSLLFIALAALPVAQTVSTCHYGPWCKESQILPSFADASIRRSMSSIVDRSTRLQYSSRTRTVMHLRGGSTMFNQPRVVSVHDHYGWKNVTDINTDSNLFGQTSQIRGNGAGPKGLKKSNSGSKIPFADHEHLIGMLRENRQLLKSCKSLRARAVDEETKSTLDMRIAELESAWTAYVQVNPTAENWQKVLLESSDEGKVRYVPVTFSVICNTTKVGDEIILCGDVEELGNWRESCAIVLRTCPETFPRWTCTVLLRALECIEYKYAIRRREGGDPAAPGVVVWEGHMGNRGFKVPGRAHLVQEELIEEEQFSDNWRAPRYLRMNRIDSSELYLDPEYASVYD